MRSLFLVISCLGGLALYFVGRRRFGEIGATFMAVLYLLSWQFAYHARWIAPDAVLASATAFFLLVFLVVWDTESPSFWRSMLRPRRRP